MMDLTLKTLGMTLKAVTGSDPNGEFESVLSTSHVDREGEQVIEGAFTPLPADIPIFSNHAWMRGANPIGEAVPRYEDGVLKVRGRWAPTPDAQEVRTLVEGGFLKAMSAGFLTKVRDAKDPNRILKAELIEGSTAPIPVNPKALITMAKSLGIDLTGKTLRTVVRTQPRNRDDDVSRCWRGILRELDRGGVDLLEAERAEIDRVLVDAGIAANAKAADQDRWLRAYTRTLDRQLATLGVQGRSQAA